MADKKKKTNKNKKTNKKKKTDGLHVLLDAGGFAPAPIGPIADGANALIYLAEGDPGNATLSAVAAVPAVGDGIKAASTAAKAAGKTVKAVDKATDLSKGLKKISKVNDAVSAAGKTGKKIKLAKGLNNIKLSKGLKLKNGKLKALVKRKEKQEKLDAVRAAKKNKEAASVNSGRTQVGAKGVSQNTNRQKSMKDKNNKNKQEKLKGKCFTGDTLILTRCGLQPIKEIREGDDICSRNAQTGETGFRKAAAIFQTEACTIHHIWLDGKEEMKTTAYHPLYVKEKGWVSAINLREGNLVETMEGTAQVTKIDKVRQEEPVEVYNFHVEEWESYFVSAKRVFVHNCAGEESVSKKHGGYSSLDDGLNFSNKASQHMGEKGRYVPVHTLQDAIRHGEAMPDPRGSSATMYYTTMYRNGKKYNLEVLYDAKTNTVFHFEYARKAMGNLPAIK